MQAIHGADVGQLEMNLQRGRETVDGAAKQLVLDSYREGCRKNLQSPFDAALNSYLSRYPHASRELAGYAGDTSSPQLVCKRTKRDGPSKKKGQRARRGISGDEDARGAGVVLDG